MNFPTDTDRITIIGKTGSGKTQGAAWLLSHRSFTRRPWVVFDFKHDALLNEIPRIKEIGVTDKPPRKPGLFIVHPTPAQTEETEALMWKIWEQEKVGVYIDEGYMIPDRSPAFQAILTQGRSKNIPVMMLTQRPSWVTRFAFSEADFIQLYRLTDTRDEKTVKQFMPLPIEHVLPAYHSYWWDNARNHKAVLKPVPDRDSILQTFADRLGHMRKQI